MSRRWPAPRKRDTPKDARMYGAPHRPAPLANSQALGTRDSYHPTALKSNGLLRLPGSARRTGLNSLRCAKCIAGRYATTAIGLAPQPGRAPIPSRHSPAPRRTCARRMPMSEQKPRYRLLWLDSLQDLENHVNRLAGEGYRLIQFQPFAEPDWD